MLVGFPGSCPWWIPAVGHNQSSVPAPESRHSSAPVSWKDDFRLISDLQNGWAYQNEIIATVEALEKVSVPAGSFDTYRIRLVVTYRGTQTGRPIQSGRIEDTYWYAPAAKNFVKRTYVDPAWSNTRENSLASASSSGSRQCGDAPCCDFQKRVLSRSEGRLCGGESSQLYFGIGSEAPVL
jgi:hypothetical protein